MDKASQLSERMWKEWASCWTLVELSKKTGYSVSHCARLLAERCPNYTDTSGLVAQRRKRIAVSYLLGERVACLTSLFGLSRQAVYRSLHRELGDLQQVRYHSAWYPLSQAYRRARDPDRERLHAWCIENYHDIMLKSKEAGLQIVTDSRIGFETRNTSRFQDYGSFL